MKKILTFLNIIFITIITAQAIAIIFIYVNAQKTIRDAFRISDIAKIQAGLSIFLSETNRYPEGKNLILGDPDSQILCLPQDFRSAKGFKPSGSSCQNKLLLNPAPTAPVSGLPYIYNLTQDKNGLDSYSILFSLEKGIGQKFSKGSYCATPTEIKKGEC